MRGDDVMHGDLDKTVSAFRPGDEVTVTFRFRGRECAPVNGTLEDDRGMLLLGPTIVSYEDGRPSSVLGRVIEHVPGFEDGVYLVRINGDTSDAEYFRKVLSGCVVDAYDAAVPRDMYTIIKRIGDLP